MDERIHFRKKYRRRNFYWLRTTTNCKIDHVEIAVAGAAEQFAMREQWRGVAKVAGLEFGDLLAGGHFQDIDRTIERRESDQPAFLVDRGGIFDRSPGVEGPHHLAGLGL